MTPEFCVEPIFGWLKTFLNHQLKNVTAFQSFKITTFLGLPAGIVKFTDFVRSCVVKIYFGIATISQFHEKLSTEYLALMI